MIRRYRVVVYLYASKVRRYSTKLLDLLNSDRGAAADELAAELRHSIAEALESVGNLPAAVAQHRLALEALERANNAYSYSAAVAAAEVALAAAVLKYGDATEAARLLGATLQRQRRGDPSSEALAGTLHIFAKALMQLGQIDGAVSAQDESLQTLLLAHGQPGGARLGDAACLDVAFAHNSFGEMLEKAGRQSLAVHHYGDIPSTCLRTHLICRSTLQPYYTTSEVFMCSTTDSTLLLLIVQCSALCFGLSDPTTS